MSDEIPEGVDSLSPPYGAGLSAVFDVVHRLRAPDGCPWDREQTHLSLRPYLLEETYELLEAIDSADDGKLREELGDVLLQVAMHAEIASQEARFDAADVSEAVAAKMVARHPHVFGDIEVTGAEDVLRNWERDKAAAAAAAGQSQQSVLDRVPATLPALAWTLGLQKRAARVGFDYRDRPGADSVAERATELAQGPRPERAFEELGDLLFAIVNISRQLKVNPEDALRASGNRFKDRFRTLESQLQSRGLQLADLGETELRAVWDELA